MVQRKMSAARIPPTEVGSGDRMSDKPASLGNTTKLGSPDEFASRYSYTALRFFLQSIARALLPNERINVCWRHKLPNVETVDIIYSQERERARAQGTMKCGSCWVCPLCSIYIAEQRRDELGRALLSMRDRYFAVMVTYTAQHDASMRLRPLLDKMQRAFRYVKTGKVWQEIKAEFHLVGSVRAIEATYGDAGWHPHYHEMMVCGIKGLTEDYEGAISEYSEALEAVISQRWLKGLEKQGLTANVEIALRVSTTTDDVKDYISKYGQMPLETDFEAPADEVTRGTTKTARRGNFGVWEILFQAPDNPKMKRLFLEYFEATKGRSQLQWSRGLKSLLGIDVIRDEISAEGIATETDRLLASIDYPVWRLIARYNFIGQVMTVAHTGDEQKLARLIARIREKYESDTGGLVLPEIGH